MRVLHLIDTPGPGGAETVLLHIAAGLSARSWDCLVMVPEEGWLSEVARDTGVPVIFNPGHGSADAKYLLGIHNAVRDFSPHLVHAHLLTSSVYASVAAGALNGLPVVCTFHGRPDVPLDDPYLQVKTRLLNRHTNALVCVSWGLRDFMDDEVGKPFDRARVIENGISPPSTHSGRKPLRMGVTGGDDWVVGALGNVRHAKDYRTLVRAAEVVLARRDDVRFQIAGDLTGEPDLTNDLRREIFDRGLGARMELLGFVEEVSEYLQGLDVFTSSSLTEGLPLSTVQALVEARPAVLTDCSGSSEVVEHGETGLLVPVGDPTALAEGILRLIEDRPLSKRLSLRGRQDVGQRFGLERMVLQYEALYRRMIALQETSAGRLGD